MFNKNKETDDQYRRGNREYETSMNPTPNSSSQGISQYNYNFNGDIQAARRFERHIRDRLRKQEF